MMKEAGVKSRQVDRIARLIGEVDTAADAYEIARIARDRAHELKKEELERRAAAQETAWRNASRASLGCWAATSAECEARLLVVPHGKKMAMFKSARLPAKTVLRVYAIQPRKKLAWLVNDATGEKYAMTPGDLACFGVKFYPDELTTHIAIAGAA